MHMHGHLEKQPLWAAGPTMFARSSAGAVGGRAISPSFLRRCALANAFIRESTSESSSRVGAAPPSRTHSCCRACSAVIRVCVRRVWSRWLLTEGGDEQRGRKGRPGYHNTKKQQSRPEGFWIDC